MVTILKADSSLKWRCVDYFLSHLRLFLDKLFVSNMTFLFTEPKVEDQENRTRECIQEGKRPELDTSVDNLTPEPMKIQNDTTEM